MTDPQDTPNNAHAKNIGFVKNWHSHVLPAIRRLGDAKVTIQSLRTDSKGTIIFVEHGQPVYQLLSQAERKQKGDRVYYQAFLCCCRVIWMLN